MKDFKRIQEEMNNEIPINLSAIIYKIVCIRT